MCKVMRTLAGLLLGAVVGVSLVLLFAPRSGSDTRRLIQERVQEILEEGRQAAERRRQELVVQLEALKQPRHF